MLARTAPHPPAGSEPYEPHNVLDRLSRRSTLEHYYAHIMRRERAAARPPARARRAARCCRSAAGGTPGATCSRRPSFRLVGVDSEPDRVAGVLSSGRADEAFVGYAGRLELPDRSFDVVLYRLVLHHLAFHGPLEPYFAEAARLLRPGGALVAIEPGLWHPVGAAPRARQPRRARPPRSTGPRTTSRCPRAGCCAARARPGSSPSCTRSRTCGGGCRRRPGRARSDRRGRLPAARGAARAHADADRAQAGPFAQAPERC